MSAIAIGVVVAIVVITAIVVTVLLTKKSNPTPYPSTTIRPSTSFRPFTTTSLIPITTQSTPYPLSTTPYPLSTVSTFTPFKTWSNVTIQQLNGVEGNVSYFVVAENPFIPDADLDYGYSSNSDANKTLYLMGATPKYYTLVRYLGNRFFLYDDQSYYYPTPGDSSRGYAVDCTSANTYVGTISWFQVEPGTINNTAKLTAYEEGIGPLTPILRLQTRGYYLAIYSDSNTPNDCEFRQNDNLLTYDEMVAP